MNKSELQAKITKMEKGLGNPNIQGTAREALQTSLEKARAQLANLEQVKPPAKATKAKPITKKTATPNTVYSWRKKTDVAQLSPVQIKCRHYHLKVEKSTKVSLKRTGKSSMVVTAQVGDHIIFDNEGYAVYIMEGNSFSKKCSSGAKTAKPKAGTNGNTRHKKKTQPKKTQSNYSKSIRAFNSEVEQIRKNYKQPEADQAKVKKDLKELAGKAEQKNYVAFVERKIKRLQSDKVRATKAEIIRIGVALRPLVQTLRGILQDAASENRKVLEPNYENLIRWAKAPGQYDLAGVDAAATRKATTKAKVSQKEEQGFLAWLFGN